MSRLVEDAVDAEAHPHVLLLGLEVDVGDALVDRLTEDRVDELHDRRVVGRGVQATERIDPSLVALVIVVEDRLADRALQRVDPGEQRLDVGGVGDDHPALQAGRHLDVVGGEHVGRIGHRHQQHLGVDVADRNRLVAPRRGDRQQVRRRHVDGVEGEVDMVEAVALGDRPRELAGVDRVLLQQQPLGRFAGEPALPHRRLDPFGAEKAELDQDVGDEARFAPVADRLGDSGGRGRLGGERYRRIGVVGIGVDRPDRRLNGLDQRLEVGGRQGLQVGGVGVGHRRLHVGYCGA